MSLYLKNKRNESQDAIQNQPQAERRSVPGGRLEKADTKKSRLKTNIKRKWKELSRYSGRIYSMLGVLCVLAVVICVAIYEPVWSKAATTPTNPTGWADYNYSDNDTSKNLGEWEFNTGGKKLGDLTFIGTETQDGQTLPCAAVTTEDELKAVVSGLKTEDDAGNTRTQEVIFKLTTDLNLNWTDDDIPCIKQKTDDNYTGNWFKMDTFDGQGHVITCAYSNSFPPNLGKSYKKMYYGMLFSGVGKDAIVQNLKVSIDGKYEVSISFDNQPAVPYYIYLGIGGVCGVADNASFRDVEVSGKLQAQINMACDRKVISLAGIGGLVGTMQSNVTLQRCEDGSEIISTLHRGNPYSNQDAIVAGVGGIVGQIVGTGNTISSCYGKGEYKSVFSGGNVDITREWGIASIVGEVVENAAVTITDCAGAGSDQRIYGAICEGERDSVSESDSDSYEISVDISVDNCYGNKTDEVSIYTYYIYDNKYSYYYRLKKTTKEISVGDIREKTNVIKEGDWGYVNGNHYLLHPCGSHKINYQGIEIGEPQPSDNTINVTGKIGAWFTDNDTQNAKAYLYISTDGSDIMTKIEDQKDTQSGHSGQNDSPDLELSGQVEYSTDKSLTVKARLKVVFDEGADTELVWWSPTQTAVFEISDLLLPRPTLQLSKEGQAYESYQSTLAYPLGTTKCKPKASGGLQSQTFWSYTAGTPNMVLGDADSDSTITVETIKKNGYSGEFTLMETMVSSASSNRVYLYVLVSGTQDSTIYYKLYEYDIVVYAKDGLISVTPGSGSKVPNGSSVTFKVGNGQAGEYPYDKMNVLVSGEQKQYSTLAGVNGVETFDQKKGQGTAENPYYLMAKPQLTGDPGQKFYLYVEPLVAKSYEDRYGKFVQEYTYTIMKKATGLELSPSTIKTSDSGSPTSIPIKEKIYMNAKGNSDIIVYRITETLSETSIKPVIVTDDATLAELKNASVTSVGENAYYFDKTNAKVLYVRCNDLWYSMDNANEALRVYEDGSLWFESSYAGKTPYVSTLLFSAGYDPSENEIYQYRVDEQDAVAAPTALLAGGSSISMNKVLNFSCGQNCIMYYTTNGKDPQVSVDSGTEALSAGAETLQYAPEDGIAVTAEKGFSYGDTVTIKIVAYPVKDASAETPVYNSDKKSSAVATFTYTIVEQNQVATPKAYPETSTDQVTVMVNGDRISLSCETSGAEIYYTVNGSTPSIDAEHKYTDAIAVNGDYGSYFTVKAIAHKEGMKDSEVATFLYQIAEKDTVSGVTAIPSTANTVIAGDKIILSTTESGATIYYTVDGTTPEVEENAEGSYTLGKGVLKYDPEKSITVPEGSGYFIIYAIAVKANMTNSPVAEFIYSYADAVGVPYGNPSPGTVTENTQVILQCAQKDAIIYYEIAYEGAEPAKPTTSSAVFSEKAPIIITRDTKIKAFAYYNRESSAVVTLSYTLAQKMDAPSSSVNSGAIVPSGTTVKLSSGGGKVYYTTDGSDPSDSKNTAVNIGSEVVIVGKAGDKVAIKACAKEAGATTSELVTFTYQISQYTGGVTTDTETGSTLAGGTSIHLMTDVTGGTIYYTTGSGSPITAGTSGNSVALSGEAGTNITVKAVAIAPNTTMTGSYASFDYQLMEQLAAPNASLKDGTRLTEKTSVVLKANKGKIYFTIDGTDPTKASNEYTAPIVVSKDMTIKAIAMEEGSENSEVSTFSYTFAEKVKSIETATSTGTVQSGEVVKLSCATEGARIYYTTDGTDPSPDAEEGVFLYDEKEGISIYRSVNIKAIAVVDGLCDSEIVSLNYQVDEVPVEIEREKAAEQEAQEGLKPSDVTNLANRRVQPANEAVSTGEILKKDVNNGITVCGKLSAIPQKATISAKEIAISDNAAAEIRKLLGDDYELVCNYGFTLYEQGVPIQPKGQIEIGIPIPAEYANADVAIISINENDGVKAYTTRRENGYAYAEVSYLNNFAIAAAKTDEDRIKELDLVRIMSMVAGGLVLVGIGMITVTLFRRKWY